MILNLIILITCQSALCLPLSSDSEYSGVDLSYLGSSIFGKPSNETGKKVEMWNEKSGINPEELGEYVEGDILFPNSKTKNGLIGSTYRWPNGVVPFEIRGSFTKQERQFIITAMNLYHKYTCIRFRYRSSSDIDYVSIDNGRSGCWSSVGRVGGRQTVNLQSPGCLAKIGTPLHELLHAIGFQHEQNRWERDSYVQIKWSNIDRSRWNNFQKMDKSLIYGYGVSYDYNSVMHYSPKAFTNNGEDTIIPLVKDSKMGQRDGFSKGDLEKILAMYNCKESDINTGYTLIDEDFNSHQTENNILGGLGSIVSWFLPNEGIANGSSTTSTKET